MSCSILYKKEQYLHQLYTHGVECGQWTKAQVPADQATGYGPQCSARMAELAGTSGNGRRMGQTFCASVLQVPISVGAIQKALNRVTHAIPPPLRRHCHAGPTYYRQ